MPDVSRESLERRSFISRLAAGTAAFGAAFAARGADAQPPSQWKAERHNQDDWLDRIPGKHRFFFDSATPNGAGDAITFSTNYYLANRSGYNLGDSDLAVVICLRHWSTPFAWTDNIWARYAAPLAERIKFVDPKTNAPATINVYQSTAYGMQLPNRGTTLDAMIRRGTQFAVCDMATRAFAGILARAVNSSQDAVYEELKANSIANCHYVPAGIVAVNRAQARGYALYQAG